VFESDDESKNRMAVIEKLDDVIQEVIREAAGIDLVLTKAKKKIVYLPSLAGSNFVLFLL